MTKTLGKSVVFITGTFVGNNCWDEWKLYFESKGYQCIAPAWPYKDAPPEELRNRHPDIAIASNRLTNLVDYFAAVINGLPEHPILIGHSLGGLIAQLLLQRGLGTAGIAIHSFPPQGVSTFKFSFLKAIWETMGFCTASKKTYLVSFKKWKYFMVNCMRYEQQKQLYYRYAVPESKLVIRDTFKSAAKINFKNHMHPYCLFPVAMMPLSRLHLIIKIIKNIKWTIQLPITKNLKAAIIWFLLIRNGRKRQILFFTGCME